MLPLPLHERAIRRAHEKGVSLGKLIRDSLSATLLGERPGSGGDVLLGDNAVYRGVALKDTAEDHDCHLDEERE